MAKVTLRQKIISKNRSSLYLDFYPPIPHPKTGKTTRREFLKLYLFDKPNSPIERAHNKTTRTLAESIRAQRQIDVQQGRYQFLTQSNHHINLIDYFQEIAQKRRPHQAPTYATLWGSAQKKLVEFTKGQLPLNRVNQQFCEEFKNFLLTTAAQRRH